MTDDIVSTEHPDYQRSAKARKIWCDVMQGTLAMRKTEYLPQFPAELPKSWDFRKDNATFFNITEKTRNVMTGLVFQAPIELESDVMTEISSPKGLWENFDNTGTHGDVFWCEAFEMLFEGYVGVLTDDPGIVPQSSREEKTLALRPYAIAYSAANIINWRYRINAVSKAKELEQVVLKETSNESDGQFKTKQVVRYRVLKLTGSVVAWELWEQKDASTKEVVMIGNGTMPSLTQIPFAVAGELGANPPLLDIALKNVEHFQTYSDYKTLIHKTCVPLLVAKDLVQPPSGETLVISADKLTEVSKDGDLIYTELKGHSLEIVRLSLLDNREEIALMGLSLLADKTAKVDITATEALLNSIGETAELRVLAREMQDAIEFTFGNIAEYYGQPRDKGGSVVMGTAWNMAEKKAEEDKAAKQQADQANIAVLQAKANQSTMVN